MHSARTRAPGSSLTSGATLAAAHIAARTQEEPLEPRHSGLPLSTDSSSKSVLLASEHCTGQQHACSKNKDLQIDTCEPQTIDCTAGVWHSCANNTSFGKSRALYTLRDPKGASRSDISSAMSSPRTSGVRKQEMKGPQIPTSWKKER